MQGRDLRDAAAAVGQEHQLGAQGDAPDGLPADLLQFGPLGVGQLDVEHGGHLPPTTSAKSVPHF
jgi:hypothetical protein